MYGTELSIGIYLQNSFNPAVWNPGSVDWIPMVSETIGVNKPSLVSKTMRGVFEEGDDYQGANTNDGDITMEVNPISIGTMFYAAMGAPTTAGLGPYTHTFKPLQVDFDSVGALPPVAIVKSWPDAVVSSDSVFYDMNCSDMELSVANGELVTAKFSFVGGSFFRTDFGVGQTYPVDKEFTWDGSSVSIGDVAQPALSQVSLKMNNSIQARHTLSGDITPSRIKRNGFRTLDISGTLLFDDGDEYLEFLGQTERKLIATFVNSSSDSITITVPIYKNVEFKPMADGPGEMEVSFTSKGKYSTGSATLVEIELVNDKAAY